MIQVFEDSMNRAFVARNDSGKRASDSLKDNSFKITTSHPVVKVVQIILRRFYMRRTTKC